MILLIPAVSYSAAEEDTYGLFYNGDFDLLEDGAFLPAGWQFSAYDETASSAGLYHDPEWGDCLGIVSSSGNDARIYQDIPSEPFTLYEISAMIRTKDVSGYRGATISIDNYDLDGTYCYSEDLTDTEGWERIFLRVMTGDGQTTLRVCFRLGGYGTLAKGTAWFADISCDEVLTPLDSDYVDLRNETGAEGTVWLTADDEDDAEDPLSQRRSLLWMCLLTALLLFMGAYLYVYRLRTGTGMRRIVSPEADPILILFIALVLRIAASVLFYGHKTDINCFMSWGNAVLNGMDSFYTGGMFADYPPGYMYVCGALAWIGNTLGLGYGTDAYALLFKIPAAIADAVMFIILIRLARRKGIEESFSLLMGAILVLNPAIIFVSGAWGQVDSLLTLGLLLTVLLLQGDLPIAAGTVYAVSVLLKPQALIAGPMIALFYFRRVRDDTSRIFREVLPSVACAFAVLFLLALPFRGSQPFGWLIGKYLSTASGYQYASVEAFNFMALIGGNWTSADATVAGIPFRTLGTVCILFSVLGGSLLYWKGARKDPKGAMFLSLSFMMASVFTFGHFMHERYLIPALLLLPFAYLSCRDRRIWIPFLLYSGSVFLNVTAAMYIVDPAHRTARGLLYSIMTGSGGALTTIGTVLLGYVSWSILWKGSVCPVVKETRQEKNEFPRWISLGKLGSSAPAWTRKEKILLAAFTAAYAVIQLLNLGSLKAPQTYWDGSESGESFTVRFDGRRHVEEIWVNGNIADGGTLRFLADDGAQQVYTQRYDDMFRWHSLHCGMDTNALTISLHTGSVRINEIALIDENGTPIPVFLDDDSGTQRFAFDEQDTIPAAPSYYNGMYLDELYHGRTAYEHLHNLAPYENSHPPLGKLILSIGIAVFGMTPFGWRISGALIGIFMLPVFYVLARKLTRSSGFAMAGTVLFAFDFMHFTQTRIATIDVYAVFFILLMYERMYTYMTLEYFHVPYRSTLIPLGMCGVFFGLGTASKWICIYAGGGLAVLFFATLISRYRTSIALRLDHDREVRRRADDFPREAIWTLLFCCVFFVAIPFLIYFLSYIPYYRYEASVAEGAYSLSDCFRTFWRYQDFMYSYHANLRATHAYQSAWYEWPFTVRPMWYYFSSGGGKISTMSASGNPAVWWISSIGTAVLFSMRAARRVDRDPALFLIAIGILANYLPWILVSRCTFIYHFFATVPFILLATLYLLRGIEIGHPSIGWIKWAWAGAALVLFLLLYPGVSGLPVPAEWAALLKLLPGGRMMYGA